MPHKEQGNLKCQHRLYGKFVTYQPILSPEVRIRTVFTRIWPVLWIHIGFNADTEPAFYLNGDPYPIPDPGSQTNADPCGSSGYCASRMTRKIHFMQEIVHKTFLRRYNSLFDSLEFIFICYFVFLILDLDSQHRIRYFQRTLEPDSGTRLEGSELQLQKKVI